MLPIIFPIRARYRLTSGILVTNPPSTYLSDKLIHFPASPYRLQRSISNISMIEERTIFSDERMSIPYKGIALSALTTPGDSKSRFSSFFSKPPAALQCQEFSRLYPVIFQIIENFFTMLLSLLCSFTRQQDSSPLHVSLFSIFCFVTPQNSEIRNKAKNYLTRIKKKNAKM